MLFVQQTSLVEWSTFDGKSTHTEGRDVLTVYSQLTILQFLFSEAFSLAYVLAKFTVQSVKTDNYYK